MLHSSSATVFAESALRSSAHAFIRILRISSWKARRLHCTSAARHRDTSRPTTSPDALNCRSQPRALSLAGGCDGLVALGAVIRGQTPHFEYIAAECARGLMNVQLETGRPIGFGILTTEYVRTSRGACRSETRQQRLCCARWPPRASCKFRREGSVTLGRRCDRISRSASLAARNGRRSRADR